MKSAADWNAEMEFILQNIINNKKLISRKILWLKRKEICLKGNRSSYFLQSGKIETCPVEHIDLKKTKLVTRVKNSGKHLLSYIS